jgi:uncharacterized membrane protein
VNASIDLTALMVAMVLLLLAFVAAARTRSQTMRITLLAVATAIIALMLWNLATHGGFHAV